MYDAADSVLAQKLSQVEGVGQVTVGGSAKPAVRVELNPRATRKATASGSTRSAPPWRPPTPIAQREASRHGDDTLAISATDQLFKAAD